MQMILLVWLILLPATTLAGATLAKHSELDTARPDFAAIRDVQTKKSAFFDYLMPFVLDANAAIEAERARLLQMEAINATGRALSSAQQADLLRLAKRYRLPTAQHNRPTDKLIAQVLQRVDVVPASLILAQAANESGWARPGLLARRIIILGCGAIKPVVGSSPGNAMQAVPTRSNVSSIRGIVSLLICTTSTPTVPTKA